MHKDTAKWLLTFVPIPTFLTLVISLGTRLTAIQHRGVLGWTYEFPVPAIAVATTVIASIVIIVKCCQVLLVGPTDLPTLRTGNSWSDAFGKYGVGEPLFPSADEFQKADNKRVEGQATDTELKAIADTYTRLIALSEKQNAAARFRSFAWYFGACAVAILAGLLVANATLPNTPDPVTKPTKSTIGLPPGTEAAFTTATGCVNLTATTAIAISGLWNRPTLRLIGPGCPSTSWTPPPDLDAVITPG